MHSMLPIISVTDLQRSTKNALGSIETYAVVQSHGRDVAVILTPELGRALLESEAFQKLLDQGVKTSKVKKIDMTQLDQFIGEVLRELSKK